MYDSDKRKVLAGLCHGSIFFSSLVVSVCIPIAILLVSDDPVVKENAKESLNFHFNVWLYEAFIGLLLFSVIGIPLAWLLLIPFFLFHWVLPIIAILHILGNPEQPYRYPFIFRIL
ncbi:MAG: DUF4870 domain-containing protein [Oscillatoria sp. Prado101]|jgi:uncharacterized Tic20 family protein|nr:DUF4870 domain-containing protein [Oscillatoria sp. Prado101]